LKRGVYPAGDKTGALKGTYLPSDVKDHPRVPHSHNEVRSSLLCSTPVILIVHEHDRLHMGVNGFQILPLDISSAIEVAIFATPSS